MPLPKVEYKLDQYHNGQHIITKVVNGVPEGEEGRYWDAAEAGRDALELSIKHLVEGLFPYNEDDLEANEKTSDLVDITRKYFSDLLRILPLNDDAQYARQLVRQAHNFARTAILLDGVV
jgi:predicted xylose isomerase-like sugar epimerase